MCILKLKKNHMLGWLLPIIIRLYFVILSCTEEKKVTHTNTNDGYDQNINKFKMTDGLDEPRIMIKSHYNYYSIILVFKKKLVFLIIKLIIIVINMFTSLSLYFSLIYSDLS